MLSRKVKGKNDVKKRSDSGVLRYSNRKNRDSALLSHYQKWREDHGIPFRCDNQKCSFYHEPLIWNGEKLGLILDHKNGVWKDNNPENLWFLCPNCDSQQVETRGGANKGRVLIYAEEWYLLKSGEYRLFLSDG